jgi:hypothetical protein
VILVGSDVDTGLFAAALNNGILEASERTTVYLSGIDSALRFSNLVFGRERLGQVLDKDMPAHVREALLARDELALIDVTDAEDASARNGHSYFRDSPWVSSDILATLAYRLAPRERGLVRPDPGLPIWSYPPDFIERLRRALKEPTLVQDRIQRQTEAKSSFWDRNSNPKADPGGSKNPCALGRHCGPW